MLHIQIDPHSGIPVYRQVMDQVRYYVASGTLRTGDRLPSIRSLSKALAVNPTTIVKAYNELSHAGAIELRQGKGAFIVPPDAAVTPAAQKRILSRLARQLAVEAAQLGASPSLVAKLVEEQLAALNTQKEKGDEAR